MNSHPVNTLPEAEHEWVRIARALALRFHCGQRYGSKPYWTHLESVVLVLVRFGFKDPAFLAAAWLHDILEDTAATPDDLRGAGLPECVVALVVALTDEPGASRAERKARTYPKIAACPGAVALKLADRLANLEAAPTDRIGKMYAGEYSGFLAALYRPGDVVEPLWIAIETILRPYLAPEDLRFLK